MKRKMGFDKAALEDLRTQIRGADPSQYAASEEGRKLSLKKLIAELYDDLRAKLDSGWTMELLAEMLRQKLGVKFTTITLRNYLNSIRKERKAAASGEENGGESGEDWTDGQAGLGEMEREEQPASTDAEKTIPQSASDRAKAAISAKDATLGKAPNDRLDVFNTGGGGK